MCINNLARHITPRFNVADSKALRFRRLAIVKERKNDQKTHQDSGEAKKSRTHPEAFVNLHPARLSTKQIASR